MSRFPATISLLSCALAAVSVVGCDGTEDPNGGETRLTVTVELDDLIPTVVHVNGTVEGADVEEAFVEYGEDDTYGTTLTAALEDARTFGASVLGLPALTDVHLRVGAVIDGETLYTDDRTTTTAGAPADLPDLTLTGADPDASMIDFLVTSVLSSPSAAVIIDREGRYVWWYQDETDRTMTRARLSRDGEWMTFLGYQPVVEGGDFQEGQEIIRIRLDGSEMEIVEVDGANHDFLELADGTLAMLVYDVRDVDDEPVVADRIMERTPDGEWVEVWSIWDHADYDPSQDPEPGFTWTHANALDYLEDEDAYVVSLRNFSTIFKVDRASGEVIWQIGGLEGDFGDFELRPTTAEPFHNQHQFQVQDDGGLLVFDNQNNAAIGSRVVEYELDTAAGVATERFLHSPDPTIFCYGLGDVWRLDTDRTLVTWSSAGQIDELVGDEPIWQLNLDVGGGFGYTVPVHALQ